jgi:hypothetical protein
MSLATNPLGQTTNFGSSSIQVSVGVETKVSPEVVVTTAQSGCTFSIPAQVGDTRVGFTLPPVSTANGCNWKFLVKGATTVIALRITTGAGTPAIMYGCVNIQAVPTYQGPGNTITGAAALPIGSQLEIWSDGVNYYYRGHGNVANAYAISTAAAP